MKLKVTLVDPAGGTDDLLVTVDATATVGQLAHHLAASHPRRRADAAGNEALSLALAPGSIAERVIDPTATMADAGVRNGDHVIVVRQPAGATGPTAVIATLTVVEGPDAGRTFPLPAGTSTIGRDAECDVRLSDPLVSKRHARIQITDMVELVDEQSANGIVVAGEVVQRVALTPGVDAWLGESRVTVALHSVTGAGNAPSGHAIEFNRSPRVDMRYAGVEMVAPEPPQRPQAQRFPIVTVIAPILMGAIMYSVTKNPLSLLFVGLSPIMAVGAFFENRWATQRAMLHNAADYRVAIRDFAVQLHYVADIERARRRQEHPSIGEVVDGVHQLGQLVWTRRPEHASFGQVRLGLGRVASRNVIRMPVSNNTVADLWRELQDVASEFATIDRVPVVADPAACGSIGVAGPTLVAHPLAASVVAQFAALHSPAELIIGCIASPTSAARWEWLKWLPHVGSEHSPLPTDHLCATRPAVAAIMAALDAVIAARTADGDSEPSLGGLPRIVVVVEDDAPADRARLVQIAERGRAAGVCLVWVAASLERLPAACRTYLEVDPNSGRGCAGFVHTGLLVDELDLEPLADDAAVFLARRIAPLVDAGAILEDASDLPRAVALLSLTGPALANLPEEVLQRWAANNSLPVGAGAPRLKRDNHLRALVGQSSSDRLHLDLRAQGPHALVGGTTGAGKSEFLQSWIIGMATAHSPTRVNFLLVDYKGGAAFADCVDLPHTVGLVTDLTPHLVRRALRSLDAELRRREHILNRKKAKDLLELERRRDPDAPPSLVIIVDEFAALVSEVPEFVDGVVNVAQRGRSLGLHLILATQRPAGVIRGNLRANTNLRVALRMADEIDSDDVIGTRHAAAFDPAIPGRAIAKSGPGQLIAFQSAYVGGHSQDVAPAPPIDVVELTFGLGATWDPPAPDIEPDDGDAIGPSDIHRIVANVRDAAQLQDLPVTARPWLPELAASYRLEDLPTARNDRELIFGVLDLPDTQSQPVVGFVPDRDGNMAVFGTGGAGKSTFLRTMAVAAGFAPARGGPVTVYGIDFGARGLHMLEPLPHVGAVINGEDNERLVRLIRQLRATIDERATRYAGVAASTIAEYRERSAKRDEARILVLLDGFGGFRQSYELGPQSKVFETFLSIAADGRSTGVHVIVTADRPATVPASLSSAIQKRLILRLANDIDYSLVGISTDALSASSPPGRGFLDGHEVQVGVLGGDPNVARQSAAFEQLAAAMARAGVRPVERIAALPERVVASSLPESVGGLPVLGVWDETMGPVTFEPVGSFLVAGPPQSGKTTTVASMLAAIARTRPHAPLALFGGRRSPLGPMADWMRTATSHDEMESLANELTALVNAEDPSVAGLVIVIESVADLLNTPADMALQHLVKACRTYDGFVIAEGESSTLGSSWALLQAVKASRTGIALQPDQLEGDSIFRTPFPRTIRSEFPPGRGLLVRPGSVRRVQVALPE